MLQSPSKMKKLKLSAISRFLPLGFVWLPVLCVLIYCQANDLLDGGLAAVLLVSAAVTCVLTAAALQHYCKPLSRILSRCSADPAARLSEPELLDAAFQAQEALIRQQDQQMAVYVVRDILSGIRVDAQITERCFPEDQYRSFCVAVICPQLTQAQIHTLSEKLTGSLPGKAVVFTPVFEKETLVVYAAASTIEPQSFGARLQKYLRRLTRHPLCLEVGSAVSGINRLPRSYSAAFADTDPGAASYTGSLLMAFTEQLRSGCQSQLSGILQQLEEALPQLEPAEQRYLCLQTLYTYLRFSGSQAEKPATDTERAAAYAGNQQLFRMIKHAITNLNSSTPDSEPGTASEIQSILLDYVDQNCLDSALCLNSAADYLNTSIYAVSRIFKDATGVGFKEYITGKRLQYACHLLETTRKTVSTVAAESGFENSTYFTTVFKNEYGIPPSKYRANAQHAPENEEI